jgi:hypothetical protein
VCDALALTFEEIHDRAKLAGSDAGMSLAVAMFYNDPATSPMSTDEIRWAVYVWTELDIAAVAAMKRPALVAAYAERSRESLLETNRWG